MTPYQIGVAAASLEASYEFYFGKRKPMPWTDEDSNRRAWDLYRQIQDQRATLKTYQEALDFVRMRQMGATDAVEPISKKLWEIAERMRSDLNPDWPERR